MLANGGYGAEAWRVRLTFLRPLLGRRLGGLTWLLKSGTKSRPLPRLSPGHKLGKRFAEVIIKWRRVLASLWLCSQPLFRLSPSHKLGERFVDGIIEWWQVAASAGER